MVILLVAKASARELWLPVTFDAEIGYMSQTKCSEQYTKKREFLSCRYNWEVELVANQVWPCVKYLCSLLSCCYIYTQFDIANAVCRIHLAIIRGSQTKFQWKHSSIQRKCCTKMTSIPIFIFKNLQTADVALLFRCASSLLSSFSVSLLSSKTYYRGLLSLIVVSHN